MKESILITRNLSKAYGKFQAVTSTNINIKKGQIYGLVGKNGAGKTTLLRMIVGQTMQTSGEIELFSETTDRGLESSRRRVGAMIETPSFFPYLTAAENLEYYRIQRGIPGSECIDQLLKDVGLSDTKNKKFKSFSLGMKQRLGLALAMMNNPDFLVLDEPINGLDPMGIVEIRNLLLKINEEKNVTIIISSHILSELASIATEYGFIDRGHMVEQISAEDLKEKCKECLEISVNNAEKAAVLLEDKLNCHEYEILPNNIIRIYKFTDTPSKISGLIVNNGIELNSMTVNGTSLEEYFVSLVGGGINA
ncbi:ABC transporter ATP-binding protein [Clostridium sp. UBA1056]|uniref:ABC transporter ATP-binding protein n=1 Tax=unclassified Clostridium TaxID=2614128 RepID=UPI003217AA3A